MTDSRMTDKEQANKQIKVMEKELERLKEIVNKPDRIKVPDCIDIGFFDSSTEMRILFNNNKQSLGQKKGVYIVHGHNGPYVPKKDLYLEPCKREDLKPGDVAYFNERSNPSFADLEYYYCILDNRSQACVSCHEDITVEEDSTWNYCWKVVK